MFASCILFVVSILTVCEIAAFSATVAAALNAPHRTKTNVTKAENWRPRRSQQPVTWLSKKRATMLAWRFVILELVNRVLIC